MNNKLETKGAVNLIYKPGIKHKAQLFTAL